MSETKVYGASDDLIEIEGQLQEEFGCYYERDGVRLFLGDCREVLPTLDKASIDLVLTDPPYGINHASNRGENRGASWNGKTINGDLDASLRNEVLDWCSGLPMFVFGTWKATKPFDTKGLLVWDKGPNSGMGDLRFPWKMSHEEIYVLGNVFRGHRDEGVLRGHSMISWESKGRAHPMEKPVSLLAYLLAKAPFASTILDPFMGSGSTGEACIRLGRKFIGIEIEERWCEHAAKRLDRILSEPRLPFVEERPDVQTGLWDE